MKAVAVILFLAFAIFCGAAILHSFEANQAVAITKASTLSLNE